MSEKRKVYSVTEVNRQARTVLETSMGELWVEGELSRVTLHASGHWYFTLKDERAAVSCAMFARDNAQVGFKPTDGLKVQLLARPSLFEASGRYQLIAREMEESGKGNLQEQFEKLKASLAAEGLFDADRKKKLPRLPRRIGVVTSPTGAAVRDIIQVLTRRYPNIEILLAPVVVQGPTAGKSVAAAIRYLNDENVARVSRSRINERDARSTFFSPYLPIETYERNLPHWEQERTTYFITFRLADSLPKQKLQQWKAERKAWLEQHQEPYSDEELEEHSRLFSERINEWLDSGSGKCILADPVCAKIVEDALRHFDGERYRLGDYVVMPNHVHVLVTPHAGHKVADILQSWKSFSAHEINKYRGGDGAVWQHESYDHIVRSPEQLEHFEAYIAENPEKAGVNVARVSRSRINERDARSTLSLVDVLIVGRGGGSIEDLWGFNEEVVARAIAESKIPVISAVGHEIDFTISDFVADVRAPTPSAAAELAVPEKRELEGVVVQLQRNLVQHLRGKEQSLRLRMNRAAQSYVFHEPEHLVQRYRREVATLEDRLGQVLLSGAQDRRRRVDQARVKLDHLLQTGVRQGQQQVDECSLIMRHQMERRLERDRQRVLRLESQLRMLNPLAVLGRGYSLTRGPDGVVIRRTTDVNAGDMLVTQLADGAICSVVEKKK